MAGKQRVRPFAERAGEKYGKDAYDYSRVEYQGPKKRVLIACPQHGAFYTTPNNFLYVAGCRECRGTHSRGYPGALPESRYGVDAPFLIYLHVPYDPTDTLYVGEVSGGRLQRLHHRYRSCTDLRMNSYDKKLLNREACRAVMALIRANFKTEGQVDHYSFKDYPAIKTMLERLPDAPDPDARSPRPAERLRSG